MKQKLKILYVTSMVNPKGNGVAIAVSNYAFFGSKRADIAIYNLQTRIELPDSIRVFPLNDYHSISSLPEGFSRPDLIIFNEVYKKEYLKLYKECLKLNIPYVIIPHGCLTTQAQSEKKIKKSVANFLFFNKFLKSAAAIQYLNDKEKCDSVYNAKHSIISGNGIELKNKKNKSIGKCFVYIGRYNVKVKGLDLIVNTVAKNKRWFIDNNVTVQLYGRNSGNGYITIAKMIEDNEVSDLVKLNGAVYDKEKEKLLSESYVFIQVSRHEGQPMGIMEALSYGLPCIVTYGTSFGEYVNENKCGIGVSFDEDELFEAIKKMTKNREFRNVCAKNAAIIERDFEWGKVLEKCLKQYKELL